MLQGPNEVTITTKITNENYPIRPNYFVSPLYYGRRQELYTFSNPSVFDSKFGNDGVELHACISV